MTTSGAGFGQFGQFGNATTAAASSSSPFSFGAPTSQPSLFGGAAPSAQPSPFAAATPSSQSSLFGTPTTASSLFGTPNTSSASSLFGMPNTSATAASQPSLFGSIGSATTPVASSSFLFGTPPTMTAAAAPAQPSSLGSLSASAPSLYSSLFGAPSAQSAAGIHFGAAASPATSSLFTGSQSSLFSAPAQGASPQSTLFGFSSSNMSGFSGIGLNMSQSSLFASSAPAQSSLFGAIPPQPGNALSAQQFGSAPLQLTQQQLQQLLLQLHPQMIQQQTLGVVFPQRLNDLIQKLDPRHADSPFHTALYNVVTAADVERYQRPPDMLEKLFEEATLNNPDPASLVPVQANGFEDLLRRVELQDARMKEHSAVLAAMVEAVEKMEDSISTDVETRLSLYRRNHRDLARKLFKLACRIERKACLNDSDPSLTHAEIDHKRRLDVIARNLAAPALFKDKLNDLLDIAAAGRAVRARVRVATHGRDAKDTAVIRELLQEQQNGISHLADVCRRADRDIGILEEKLKI